MEIDEMETWTDAALTLYVDIASVAAYDRFVAALELWHRGRRSIAQLTATCEEQSEHISEQGARIAELEYELSATKAQLPDDMQGCTIVARECRLGHSWLTAMNWVEFDCPTCRWKTAEAERDKLREAGKAVLEKVRGHTGLSVAENAMNVLEATLGEGGGEITGQGIADTTYPGLEEERR